VNYSWSTPQSNSDGECSAVFCERPRDRGLDSSLGCSAMRSVYAASLCARRGQIHSRNDAIPVSRCVALTCSSQDAGCGTGNELPSDGTYKCTYDAAGNMTSQTNIANDYVTYYTWDYRNRLVEVKQEDNHNNVLNDEKFTYDINNNRIAVSLNGTPQLYTVYDGSNPYMDFNGSGQLTERYLYNPNALSQFYGQVNASGAVQWFLTDNIHSIRQVVSSSGNVLDAITYDPYGNILNQTNAANAPRFLYAGGAYDSLTGYDQFGRRYYSPVDGRWTSQDPLGFRAGDANLYRYVFNVPTNAWDPTGADKWGGIGGAVEGTSVGVGVGITIGLILGGPVGGIIGGIVGGALGGSLGYDEGAKQNGFLNGAGAAVTVGFIGGAYGGVFGGALGYLYYGGWYWSPGMPGGWVWSPRPTPFNPAELGSVEDLPPVTVTFDSEGGFRIGGSEPPAPPTLPPGGGTGGG
jgi:RHS repeat-associated protein